MSSHEVRKNNMPKMFLDEALVHGLNFQERVIEGQSN